MSFALLSTAVVCLALGVVAGMTIAAGRARAGKHRAAETERKLRLLMREQAAILEHAAYAIVATTPDGIITTYNPAAERLFGYPPEEVVGKTNPGIVHDRGEIFARSQEIGAELGIEVEPGFAVFTAKADRGLPNEYEWTYVRKDGSRVPGLLSVTALRDEAGTIVGYLGIALDISERHRAAEALRQATNAAETANRAKSEFLAMMSHEIRTPMNGVLGFANLLRDTPLTELQHDYVATINNPGKALLAIIKDILDFSKIEAGKLVVERLPVDLVRQVRESVTLLSAQAEHAGLDLRAEFPPEIGHVTVMGDEGRVRQLLLNLIGNAIKFTERGGVTVRIVHGDGNAAGAWRVEVQDTGIGIPKDRQANLFEHFTQADASTTRRFGGTGLGLAITKQLVLAMNGTVGMETEQGVGSTFWFMLPATTELPPSEIGGAQRIRGLSPARPKRDDAAPVRVLLCEDNPVNQRFAIAVLEGSGFRVDVAATGSEGISMWEQFRYDVILMDCHMPEMDGFEATRAIRAREETGSNVPIIALTASAMESDRDFCLSMGMDDFVSKPVHPDELRTAVRRWAGRKSSGTKVFSV